MKKVINEFFCICIFMILLVPLFRTNTEGGAVSNVDGSNLIKMLSAWEGSDNADTEVWLKKRLGFHDELLEAHEVINDKLFSELINPVYQYGKDRYTFFKIHDNIKYGDYHATFANMVGDMQKYCETRGSRFYYVFNPEKESVYREQLPEGVNYNDEWVDNMLSEMRSLGVNVIDLRDSLKSSDVREEPFDKINDAGRWNHNGAYLGMKELTKQMHTDMAEVKILEKNEYDILTSVVEKIYGSNKTFNEEVPKYVLKNKVTDATGDLESELKMDPNNPVVRLIRNDSDNASGINRLLLFEDDFYAPFAHSRAKNTLDVICTQNVIDFDYYYNIFKPDVVVFENMEYIVKDAYFSQSAMEAANYNPAIIENYPENSFEERRASLIANTDDFEISTDVSLIKGKEIDKIFITNSLSQARYAWLVTDSRAIDLKRNGQGAFIASIRHGEVQDGESIVLLIQTEDGTLKKAVIGVTSELQNIASISKTATDNTNINRNDNTAVMNSGSAVNSFSYAAINLYDADIKENFANMGVSYAVGDVDGAYSHELPTGEYKVLLVACGNSASEWTSYDVYLEEGKTYWFSYSIDEFSAERVKFSEFRFSEAKQ